MQAWAQIYLVPGAVFVSVIMGGGYGTGREVVEFFTRYGLQGGLYGIALATSAFAIVLFATFEFARRHGAYDYRSFFGHLLGRYWWLFEVLYLLLFLLILGVLSSAASNLLEEQLGVPPGIGLALLSGLIAALVGGGKALLERVLALWSLGMYLVFAAYFVSVWGGATESLTTTVIRDGASSDAWWHGGLLYPLYNVAVAPVLLFVVAPLKARRQTLGAALIAAVLIMLPALLFHLSYAAGYPAVLDEAVPNYWMIGKFAAPWLLAAFFIMLFGTLVETGAGLVFGFMERIEQARRLSKKSALGNRARLMATCGILLAGALLGRLGLVTLIASGYSALAVGFALVYVLPLLVVGVWRK